MLLTEIIANALAFYLCEGKFEYFAAVLIFLMNRAMGETFAWPQFTPSGII